MPLALPAGQAAEVFSRRTITHAQISAGMSGLGSKASRQVAAAVDRFTTSVDHLLVPGRYGQAGSSPSGSPVAA
jgi:hypothetical protein